MKDPIIDLKLAARQAGRDTYQDLDGRAKTILKSGGVDAELLVGFTRTVIPWMQQLRVAAHRISEIEHQFVIGMMETAADAERARL